MWFQSKTHDIICIGSVSRDIFFPTDEAVIIETPEDITSKQKIAFELGGKYRVSDRFEALGGVAANVACGLARLGHQSAAYTCVGNDQMGKTLVKEFETEKVATDLVMTEPDALTDLSAIVVMTQNGERTIFHNRDANERLVVEKKKLLQAAWLFVGALNGDWKKNLATILETKEISGAKLAFNPGQHNIKEDPQLVFATISSVDVLILNKDEAIELLLQSEPQPTTDQLNDEIFLLRTLSQAGAKTIGMTDGKRGSWGYDGQEFWYCPIHTRSDVVDSTGAGDAFSSAFLAAHISGEALPLALRYGMANSGSVVGFYGAITGLLKQKEMIDIVPFLTPERLLEKEAEI